MILIFTDLDFYKPGFEYASNPKDLYTRFSDRFISKALLGFDIPFKEDTDFFFSTHKNRIDRFDGSINHYSYWSSYENKHIYRCKMTYDKCDEGQGTIRKKLMDVCKEL